MGELCTGHGRSWPRQGTREGAGSSIRGMNGMRRARLLQAMREVDGVARVERLRERGVSRYDLETAVAERIIHRVRVGGWRCPMLIRFG